MNETQQLREFWTVPTFEQARDERVTIPANPAAYTDDHQADSLRMVLGEFAESLPPAGPVLDYGCGIGRSTRALLLAGCDVIAVDVSYSMLAYCGQYCWDAPGKLLRLPTDGYGTDVDGGYCGGAICLYVLQHVPSRKMAAAILTDLHRVLRPGGWLVIQLARHGQPPDGQLFGVELQDEEAIAMLPGMVLSSRVELPPSQSLLRFRKC